MRALAASSTSARDASSSPSSTSRIDAASDETMRRYSAQSAARNTTGTSATDTSSKPAPRTSSVDPLGLCERELARLSGFGRLHQAAVEQHGSVGGGPGIPLRGSPGRKREPAAGLEHAPRLPQRERRIRDEHVPVARDDRVDARVGEVDRLHVHDPVLGAGATAPARRLDHHRRQVRRDHARARLRERLGDVAGAGGEIEDGVARAWRNRADKCLRDRRAECRHGLALRLPADGSRVPAAPQLVLRLYAATPLNCGRMSRP